VTPFVEPVLDELEEGETHASSKTRCVGRVPRSHPQETEEVKPCRHKPCC
jgi:hypothetical protein